MARLFVAVWPSADVVAAIAALPRPDVAGLRWTRSSQWHVTLRFLGEVAEDRVGVVSAALAAAPDLRAATATLGPAVDRFGDRVLHVPVGGLEGLATAVRRAVDPTVDDRALDDRPFHGHLTLARADARRGAVRLAPLTGAPVRGSWPVTSVDLVRSRLDPGGARYEVVASVALR